MEIENEHAFPLSDSDRLVHTQTGLTKREFFAAYALSGILSCPDTHYSESAILAVKAADRLMWELEK